MSCPASPSPPKGCCASPRTSPATPESYRSGSQASRFTTSSLGTPRSGFQPCAGLRSFSTQPRSYLSEATAIPPDLVPSYHSSEDTTAEFTDDSLFDEEDYTMMGSAASPVRDHSLDISQLLARGRAPLSAKAETMMEMGARSSPCPGSISYAGKEIFDKSGMTKSKFEPWVEKYTSWQREDESSSIIGPRLDMDEQDYDYGMKSFATPYKEFAPCVTSTPRSAAISGKRTRDVDMEFGSYKEFAPCTTSSPRSASIPEPDLDLSDPERRQLGFDPYVHTHAMKKFASPYQGFAPCAASTARNAPITDKRTRDAWKYRSPAGEEEQSFWRATTPPSPYGRPSPKHKGLKPRTADDTTTAEGIKNVLGEMEHMEMSKIKKDLRDFQKARRRLIFDATHIKPIP